MLFDPPLFKRSEAKFELAMACLPSVPHSFRPGGSPDAAEANNMARLINAFNFADQKEIELPLIY
jgi:hypothetical protein